MAANPNNVIRLSTSSTNVTTSAYVQLSASTPIGTAKLVITNNTSSTLSFATGASGSEVQLVAVLPTSQLVVDLGSINIMPAGTRLSVIAIDASATTGFITVSLMP